MTISRRGFSLALLLLTLAPRAAGEDVYHDNVVIVLDASGSMGEAMSDTRVMKMDAAKQALRAVLGRLDARTQVGLLVFSGSGIREPWVYPLGPRDDRRLADAIERPQPHGGTPLGRFIKEGADRLLQARAQQMGYGSYRLLIVTDGEAQDPELVETYTPEVIARGLTVDVIGVAMADAHSLARRAHSYRAAHDAAALERALSEVFAEVSRRGDAGAGEDAFEVLAPLPDEAAPAIIQGLSASGNHPIGERPDAAASGGGAVSVPASAVTSTAIDVSSAIGVVVVGLVVALLVVVGLIVLLVKASAPRRRRG